MGGAYKCYFLEYTLARELLDPMQLQALQQPHKHSYSLKLSIHTQLAHLHIQNLLQVLSIFLNFYFFFLQEVQEDICKVPLKAPK